MVDTVRAISRNMKHWRNPQEELRPGIPEGDSGSRPVFLLHLGVDLVEARTAFLWVRSPVSFRPWRRPFAGRSHGGLSFV